MSSNKFGRKDVLAAFDRPEHTRTDVIYEHGGTWLICNTCGAQWAVHRSNRGFDFEQVTDGDDYCAEVANV